MAETKCDMCGDPAKYDAKTPFGPWAYLCEECFVMLGCLLGTGRGQKLKEEKVDE